MYSSLYCTVFSTMYIRQWLVNLPLKCEYNMMYSKMYTVSLIATNLCLMYSVLNTLSKLHFRVYNKYHCTTNLIFNTEGYLGKFTEECSVKYTVYLSIPLMESV